MSTRYALEHNDIWHDVDHEHCGHVQGQCGHEFFARKAQTQRPPESSICCGCLAAEQAHSTRPPKEQESP